MKIETKIQKYYYSNFYFKHGLGSFADLIAKRECYLDLTKHSYYFDKESCLNIENPKIHIMRHKTFGYIVSFDKIYRTERFQ